MTSYRLTLCWATEQERVDCINTPYAWFALSCALAAALRPSMYPGEAPTVPLADIALETVCDSTGGLHVP